MGILNESTQQYMNVDQKSNLTNVSGHCSLGIWIKKLPQRLTNILEPKQCMNN